MTQWILADDQCKCGLSQNENFYEIEKAVTISICTICHKRISRQKGSMTQWIFGPGICECERPEVELKSLEEYATPTFAEREEEELNVDPDKFPVDRYKALVELGKGASSIVYLARDRLLRKKVALKTLMNLSPEHLVSFQKEARAIAKLKHPRIVEILDFGATAAGAPYMVMDYEPGLTLEEYLKSRGPLDEKLARFLFSRLADALQYAHKQGVFHRDLKPGNILVFETRDSIDVCLIDFGIAAINEVSKTGMVTEYKNSTLVGTPPYMSPEIIKGKEFDERSEIYSLGCIIYEALSGTPPFLGKNAFETFNLHLEKEPCSLANLELEISKNLSDTINRCLSKDPAFRFNSMDELVLSLLKERNPNEEDQIKYANSSKKNPFLIFASILILALGSLTIFFIFKPEGENKKLERDKDLLFDLNEYRAGKITKLKKGEVIRIYNYKLTGDIIDSIKNKKKIKYIDISYCEVLEDSFNSISSFKELNGIVFSYCLFVSQNLTKLNDWTVPQKIDT